MRRNAACAAIALGFLLAGCGGRSIEASEAGVVTAETGVGEPPQPLTGEVTSDCRGSGRYEAGKEGSYRPCCPGLREVFYLVAAYGTDGDHTCITLPLRVYACVEGRCGDGVCEVGEAEKCGCAADCPGAAWGGQATGELTN